MPFASSCTEARSRSRCSMNRCGARSAMRLTACSMIARRDQFRQPQDGRDVERFVQVEALLELPDLLEIEPKALFVDAQRFVGVPLDARAERDVTARDPAPHRFTHLGFPTA